MKYHIWTEGCQMNVADSQRVASALEQLGYRAALAPRKPMSSCSTPVLSARARKTKPMAA